jgi:predicted dinucleotide-binding enzyme
MTKIGIIGAGQIGGVLTRRFRELGYAVSVANSSGPVTLAGLARETGARAVTVEAAARSNDVVIVTIPERSILDLPADLFARLADDVVVVDTGNYYPQQRDGLIAAIESGMTESGWVAGRLHRPVIKAFNNIMAEHLHDDGKAAGAAGRIALPISGDDETAKALVEHLIDRLGFDTVDNGDLDQSWRHQPGTPVYGKDFDAEGVRLALSQAQKRRGAEWRANVHAPVPAR